MLDPSASPLPRRSTSATSRHAWALAALGCLLAGGTASIGLGGDGNWDLLNYHLYGPLAWLDGRPRDLAPAGLQSFFNPTLDLPFHALRLVANDRPNLVMFVMGLPAGLALWLLLRVAARLNPDPLAVAMAGVLAATGAAFRNQIGTTFGDLATAIFVLGAALPLLGPRVSAHGFLLAGCLGGIACGLKPTNAPFALALAAMALLRGGPGGLLRLGLGGCAGALLAAGPWAATLWARTGNPAFPFLIGWFGGPWPDATTGRDIRFLPDGLLDALIFPARWAFTEVEVASEVAFRDPRALLGLPLCVLTVARRWRQPAGALAAGLLVAWVAWLAGFAIHRYFIAGELLLAALAAAWLPAGGRGRVAALVLALVIAGFTEPPRWGRSERAERAVNVALPPLPPASTLLLDLKPSAYVALGAPDAALVGLFAPADFGGAPTLAAAVAARAAAPGPRFIVAEDAERAAAAATAYGLQADLPGCRRLCTNLLRQEVGPLLCPVASVGEKLPVLPASARPGRLDLCAVAGAGSGGGSRQGLVVLGPALTLHLAPCAAAALDWSGPDAATLPALVRAAANGRADLPFPPGTRAWLTAVRCEPP